MPGNETPASKAFYQQGPALPLTLPSSSPRPPVVAPTASTGETVIASELVETPGFSPAPVLRPPSPRGDSEPFHLTGLVGPLCTRCNRCHWGLNLRCAAESAREPIRDEWLNKFKKNTVGSRFYPVHVEHDHRNYDPTAVRIEDDRAARANKYGNQPQSGTRLPTPDSGNAEPVISSSFSWWTFPAEVRNMIYDVSLHWPNSYALYRGYNKQLETYYRDIRLGKPRTFPVFSGRLATPTILLLCKHVTNECIHILQSRTFVIDRIPPWLPRADGPMSFLDFVGETTLRKLRHIDIRIAIGEGMGSGGVWEKILAELFGVLYNDNNFTTMRIMIKCCNLSNTSLWDQEEHSKFMQIKGMIACFQQRQANVWTPGKLFVENWIVEGHLAKHVVPHVPEDELETYYYPDRDIWPGSVLEFVQPTDPEDRDDYDT